MKEVIVAERGKKVAEGKAGGRKKERGGWTERRKETEEWAPLLGPLGK